MTTPFLYCMLDLILGYFVPPATLDEGNYLDPQRIIDLYENIDDYRVINTPPGSQIDQGPNGNIIDPFDSRNIPGYDDENDDPNYGEDWKKLQ